jgi:pimeloyl-ACP methyl ester carboxylesterase
MVRGLAQAGINESSVTIYDWTCSDPGLNALLSRQRNQREAQAIADVLTGQFRTHPEIPICITAHSGGAGLAVWALEKLPADVRVRTLVLLAPALSPGYDLSAALAHVTGRAYAFTSVYDSIVLGAGTRLLGTIDGVYTDAAGRVGFAVPPGADAMAQYAKLVAMPYDEHYMRYGNIGDHVGTMMSPFARAVLAPLLLDQSAQPPNDD